MPRSAAAAPTRRSARVASRVAVLCSMSMPSACSTPPCRCAGTPNLSGECTPSNDMVLDPAVLANEHCLTSDAAVGLVSLALSPAHRSAPLLNLSGETQAVSHPVGEPLFRYVSPPASPLVDSAFPSTFADPTAPRGRVSRKCVRCAEVDHRNCERDSPRHPSHIYRGDAPAHLLAPGVRGVVRAHLITPDSMHGLGSIRSWDRTVDPRDRRWFLRVMENVWYADRTISRRLVMTVYNFLTRRADLRSEREPFESVAVAGGVPEPIGTRIPIPHDPPVPS
ncbi:uncharacterized protein MEPE_06820 [Melanopsichium pennsylvanicum]|uniref:Uncharacterized protein n=1 Tax=Melanopsichium pennsylvanicum TaxID=63383 RepID=A0AAJ5C8X0_9BASI|nr:uncharacterized protein MEPE_06820 [Melanopsichium pennsylvanicum]